MGWVKPGFEGDLTHLTLRLANPTSLLGQLQRGRGQGYIRALEADRTEVHAALIQCITHDPRWDSQLESRAWYYAELMLRTNFDDLTPFVRYLRRISQRAARRGGELLAVSILNQSQGEIYMPPISSLAGARANGPGLGDWGINFECNP
jgi:hypothetical protein